MSLHFFGLLAGILSILAFIPYIIDTYAGHTRPQRASWLIWSVLGTIAFFSQVYEGATESLWFAGVQVSSTVVVLLLSVRRGKGTYFRPIDFVALAAAALGLALWYVTETAVYALAITISISLIGGALAISKAYCTPGSETLSTWLLSWIASVFALISVGSFDPVLLAYPAYLLTLYTMLTAAVLLGRARSQPYPGL